VCLCEHTHTFHEMCVCVCVNTHAHFSLQLTILLMSAPTKQRARSRTRSYRMQRKMKNERGRESVCVCVRVYIHLFLEQSYINFLFNDAFPDVFLANICVCMMCVCVCVCVSDSCINLLCNDAFPSVVFRSQVLFLCRMCGLHKPNTTHGHVCLFLQASLSASFFRLLSRLLQRFRFRAPQRLSLARLEYIECPSLRHWWRCIESSSSSVSIHTSVLVKQVY
jgi:hypothetical protein